MKVSQFVVASSLLAGEVCAWKHISESDLKKKMDKDDYTLISFVAVRQPETSACKAFESEWEQFSKVNKNAVSIDCTLLSSLCAEVDVASYPAIRLYQHDGPMIRYRGPRRASQISAFTQRVLRPIVTKLDTEEAIAFASIDDIVFIGHFHPSKDVKLAAQFSTAVAQQYRDRYSFGAGIVDASSVGGVRCYNNVDGVNFALSMTEMDQTPGALHDFVQQCTRPLIPLLTRRNEMTHLQSGKSIVFYFSDDAQDVENYTKSMTPLAKEYQQYLQLVTVDSTEYRDMARSLGITSGKRGLSIQNPHNGQIFPYRGSAMIAPDPVAQFIQNVAGGKVQPWSGLVVSDETEAEDEASSSREASSMASHDEL